MIKPIEYLHQVIDRNIEEWGDRINDAHYGYHCYKENGSGHDKKERDKQITEANEYIKMGNDMKIKLSELFK